MHPILAFCLYCQALPCPPSAESRREHLQLPDGWAGTGRTPIPVGRDGQSRSPGQHPPSTGCPDPSSSSLQSRCSVSSQLIASTHVCKLTVYRKMSQNVNFIRNALPLFFFFFFLRWEMNKHCINGIISQLQPQPWPRGWRLGVSPHPVAFPASPAPSLPSPLLPPASPVGN